MIKSTAIFAMVVALVISACGHHAAAMASPIGRQACVDQAASFLAQVQIDAPVQTLVSKSREFYPDVIELIEDEVPSNEYSDALLKLGTQVGCEPIVDHFHKLPQEVPCYEELALEKDDTSTLDIVKTSEGAKSVFEAYYACLAANALD